MPYDTSPTARALLALESIQNSPGITADRLAYKLDVSERAARRYVGILREAGLPVESVRGPYGGYRVGRGLRVPPLMFTPAEALALVMAALEGHHGTAGTTDPVESALDKIIRVLPSPVAVPTEAVRTVSSSGPDPRAITPDAEMTATLGRACATRRRLRIDYRMAPDRVRTMDVDPWAIVVRYGRWYLLCWSHSKDARRVLRVDKVTTIDVLDDTFTPPADLDPLRALDEQFSEGWHYQVDVVIDAPSATVATWLRRSLGRLEDIDAGHTRLIASTDEPRWYAEQLIAIEAPFHIIGPPELREAVDVLAQRLLGAGTQLPDGGGPDAHPADQAS